jgi:hypothetical protein
MISDEIEIIRNLVKGYKDQLPRLTILVFGPGKKNQDSYAKKCFKKRYEIRSFLREQNHKAILPEEAYQEAKRLNHEGLTITSFEKYLIEQCDLAIFLHVPNCPGVEHELSTFATMPGCIRKMLLFHANDCNYDPKWVFQERVKQIKGGNGRIETFSENEIEQCHLRKRLIDIIGFIVSLLSLYPYKKYEDGG